MKGGMGLHLDDVVESEADYARVLLYVSRA
jgi:hypothetical protein